MEVMNLGCMRPRTPEYTTPAETPTRARTFHLLQRLRFRLARFRVFEFRDPDFGFRVSGFGVRVSGFGFRNPGFGFRVSGFGCQR